MINNKQRIQATDSVVDILVKMSDGNPGALNVLSQIVKETENIDPDNALKFIGPILSLDYLGIYGTDIYILYKDLCEENISKTIGVIRATQMGIFSGVTLADACSRQDRSGQALIIVDAVLLELKKQLPNFNIK